MKPTAAQTLGIDFAGAEARCAWVCAASGGINLKKVLTFPLSGTDVKPLDICCTKQIGSLEEILVATALPTDLVLVRQLSLALSKERDIDAVLEFQAEPLLPYDAEESLLDKQILSLGDERSQVALFAAKREHVEKHIEKVLEAGITPEVVSCVPEAIALFAQRFSPIEDAHIAIHIGHDSTSCCLVSDGKVFTARHIDGGSNSLSAALIDVEPEANFTDPELKAQKKFQETVQRYCQQLQQAQLSARKGHSTTPSAEILITGNVGRGLTELLAEKLKQNLVSPMAPAENSVSVLDLQKYAVAIGLALGSLPGPTAQINFRQKTLTYPHPWKRYRRKLTTFSALSVLIALSILTFSSVWWGRQEVALQQEYVDLLQTLGQTPLEFEAEFQNRRAGNPDIPKSFSVTNLDATQVRARVSEVETMLSETADIFPLQPNIARVSDLLAWLGNHPSVAVIGDETKPSAAPISIQSIQYSMTRRPEFTRMREKYQIKVELDFTAESSQDARALRDALIAPNPFVDSKGEVKWSSSRGRYKAIFFLRDRTVYPAIGGA